MQDPGGFRPHRQGCHVPVEAGDRAVGGHAPAAVEEHCQPPAHEAVFARLGLLGGGVGHDVLTYLEVDEPLEGAECCRAVEGEAGGMHGVVDQARAVLPDEGCQAKKLGRHAGAILVDLPIAIQVARQERGRWIRNHPRSSQLPDRTDRQRRTGSGCNRPPGWRCSAARTTSCRPIETLRAPAGRDRRRGAASLLSR